MANITDEIAKENAKAKQRLDALLKRLSSAASHEVVGVVDSLGAGSSQFPGEDFWTLLCTMVAWRHPGAPVVTKPLELICKVADDRVDALQDMLEPETIVRVRARVLPDDETGTFDGLLEEVLPSSEPDPDLEASLKEVQSPPPVQHPRFGTLSFDRRLSCYATTATWNQASVELRLFVDEPGEHADAYATAEALWADERSWNERITRFAVDRLLPLKNESWRDNEEPELTAEDFISRITLDAISIYNDGRFDFWHDDGNLFWGHAVQVSGNLSCGPTHADIPG